MKKNRLGMTIGFLLIIIVGVLLFMYQVRVTEVAVKTRFGKVVAEIMEPGVGFKLPWPIERIQTFDRRVQNFEDKLGETYTQDGRILLVQVYLGWSVEKPATFRNRVKEGSFDEVERNLMSVVRSAKMEVVGKHPLSDFINTDEKQLKFAQIEKEILDLVGPQALNTYGIKIHFLGIKRLNLPDNITKKVFERMTAERHTLVNLYQSQGVGRSNEIVTAANRTRNDELSRAEADAKRIRGRADAAAAASYEVFNEQPDLAKLLIKLDAAKQALGNRATLILDTRTPPFDVLLPQNMNTNTVGTNNAAGNK
jgi:modulator of FtsH protease HflC